MKPRPARKPRPLGAAHLRGRRAEYDFEIWPLDSELADAAGVFVISRRSLDGAGRGHHKLVVISGAESIKKAVRALQRDREVKRSKANVVCLLRTDDSVRRGEIVSDLRDAHATVVTG